MAQDFSAKQRNFLIRFSEVTVRFMADVDTLTAICTEFDQNTYGTGGENALTDEIVQSILPAATAAGVWGAEGAFAGADQILALVESMRGYLEVMRP